jgi:hypothetical protein
VGAGTIVLTMLLNRISLSMLLYYLFTLAVGIEGGYSIPSVGFTDTKSGAMCAILASHDLGILDTGLRCQVGYYQGDNEAYNLVTYGVRLYFAKHAWRVSPVFDIGIDYVDRSIGNAEEKGPAMTYGLGLAINIPSERMRVYPLFFYEGITDIKRHGGFLGLKLGVVYDL